MTYPNESRSLYVKQKNIKLNDLKNLVRSKLFSNPNWNRSDNIPEFKPNSNAWSQILDAS